MHPALVAFETHAVSHRRTRIVVEFQTQAVRCGHVHAPAERHIGVTLWQKVRRTFNLQRRLRKFGSPPERDVQMMYAPALNPTGAVVCQKVPVVCAQPFAIRLERRGPQPQIVVQIRRNRSWRQPQHAASARHGGGHRVQFAEVAVAGQLAGEAEPAVGALLRARLQDAPGAPHRLANGSPLSDRQRQRLLAVHVLARLHRLNGHERMPVFRRSDRHGVNIRPRKEFAEVLRRQTPLCAGLGVNRLADLLGLRTANVAHRHDLYLFEERKRRKMVGSPVPQANDHHGGPVTGCDRTVAAERPSWNDRWQSQCRGSRRYELSAGYALFHGLISFR